MWETYHPRARDYMGLLPGIISAHDPRSVKDQITTNYVHGGGYRPLDGWKFDPIKRTIKYPGDPPLSVMAGLKVGDEYVYVYEYAWVCIVQQDGSFAVTRMD